MRNSENALELSEARNAFVEESEISHMGELSSIHRANYHALYHGPLLGAFLRNCVSIAV